MGLRCARVRGLGGGMSSWRGNVVASASWTIITPSRSARGVVKRRPHAEFGIPMLVLLIRLPQSMTSRGWIPSSATAVLDTLGRVDALIEGSLRCAPGPSPRSDSKSLLPPFPSCRYHRWRSTIAGARILETAGTGLRQDTPPPPKRWRLQTRGLGRQAERGFAGSACSYRRALVVTNLIHTLVQISNPSFHAILHSVAAPCAGHDTVQAYAGRRLSASNAHECSPSAKVWPATAKSVRLQSDAA